MSRTPIEMWLSMAVSVVVRRQVGEAARRDLEKIALGVIPGPAAGRSPGSITTNGSCDAWAERHRMFRGYGFRARGGPAVRTRPGMTGASSAGPGTAIKPPADIAAARLRTRRGTCG